ncbi:hypothetical protein, partial [Pseudomonas sp. PA-6-1D]|uniref:hypothetical protein n=1 Tax=Pseudomonas sp. PA-6-1D TaxID=2665481 RepID=UPI001F3D9881
PALRQTGVDRIGTRGKGSGAALKLSADGIDPISHKPAMNAALAVVEAVTSGAGTPSLPAKGCWARMTDSRERQAKKSGALISSPDFSASQTI